MRHYLDEPPFLNKANVKNRFVNVKCVKQFEISRARVYEGRRFSDQTVNILTKKATGRRAIFRTVFVLCFREKLCSIPFA